MPARCVTYPPAERRPIVDDLQGHRVEDPYRWLEDPASAETARWLAAQDELWRAHAAALPGREDLHRRVAQLSAPGLVTVPKWRGDRQFFLRQGSGQEHPVLYLVEPDGTRRTLIDPMSLDGSGLTTLDAWQPDPGGRLLAYQTSRRGNENSELFILDIDTGEVVEGPIGDCRYSPVAWLPGGDSFYYVRTWVYLHRVGTGVAEDVLVFGSDRDETYGLDLSRDGRWLTVAATRGSAAGNDLWLADLATAADGPSFHAVQEGVDAGTVATVADDGRLYIVTDRDAPHRRLCVADPANPTYRNWRELIPEDPQAVLTDVTVLAGPGRPVLLVSRIRHALGEIAVHDLATGERLADVPLPGAGSVGSLSTRPDGHEAWFGYTDSITPGAVYRYDHSTRETSLWSAAPGVATIPEVESRQLVCESADGTAVRVIVVARPDALGTPRPTILYGYGGFGLPVTPSYSSYLLAWVEAGGVFAIAQVRGGGEEGEQWHRDGMLDRKQNAFDDFLAAAERLITDGWTTSGQLGICGESNGGLLVAAALTQRPDLFAAAVCSAPVLDMARYERFGLGASWRGEYGSAEDPEQLAWLLGYSPYHRVRSGVDYPAVLFTAFGGDTRVDPMHARKMCAALQWATASDRPVLLRHEDEVGHAGSATSRAVALAGDMLAFLAAHTGLAGESS